MDEATREGKRDPTLPKLRNRTEAGAYLGVNRRTIEAWDKKGVGPRVTRMPSGQPRYHVDELERFAREGDTEAGSPSPLSATAPIAPAVTALRRQPTQARKNRERPQPTKVV